MGISRAMYVRHESVEFIDSMEVDNGWKVVEVATGQAKLPAGNLSDVRAAVVEEFTIVIYWGRRTQRNNRFKVCLNSYVSTALPFRVTANFY